MTANDAAESLGCDYCRKQSPYWERNEWRYVELIGSASAHLQVGRCPKCGMYYMYGAETVGRPAFVRGARIAPLLEEVKRYESSI